VKINGRLSGRPAGRRASVTVLLLLAGQALVATASSSACDLDALHGSFRMALFGRSGESVDYVGQPSDEATDRWRMDDPRAISLQGLGESVFLLRYEHLLDDERQVRRRLEHRVVACVQGRWELVPWLLAGKRTSSLDSGADELASEDGHLKRVRGGVPRAYLSWDGSALRDVKRPLRPLTRVDGLYVFWSCKQDPQLAIGMAIRVVRAGRDIAGGSLTGSFHGACEAELDARTYDGGARSGDLVEVR
jgi:hypothetical protein